MKYKSKGKIFKSKIISMGDTLYSMENDLSLNMGHKELEMIKLDAFHHGMSPAKSRAALAQSSRVSNSNLEKSEDDTFLGDHPQLEGHPAKFSLDLLEEEMKRNQEN